MSGGSGYHDLKPVVMPVVMHVWCISRDVQPIGCNVDMHRAHGSLTPPPFLRRRPPYEADALKRVFVDV